MSATAPRIGIVGGGVMGTIHAEVIRNDGHATVVAVADPANATLATDLGVDHHLDHRELLARPDLDAVVVASPNAEHVPTALACLDAGLPALLEKPVAASLEEARTLVDAAARASTPILVGHHRRHNATVAAARAFLRAGRLGRIVAVNSVFLTRKSDAYFDLDWHRRRGAGVMLINLVHDIDLLRHLCGEIVRVGALSTSRSRGYEVEDSAAATVEFADGAVGTLVVSDSAASPFNWDQVSGDDPSFPRHDGLDTHLICGTRGSLTLPGLVHHQYANDETGHWKVPMERGSLSADGGDTYANQWSHFLDVLAGSAQPLVTVADATRTLEVVEAIRAAAADGRTTDTRSLQETS